MARAAAALQPNLQHSALPSLAITLLLLLLLPPSTTASNDLMKLITSKISFKAAAALAAEEVSTPGCTKWAEHGECTANEVFMLASCPHACSAYSALTTTTTKKKLPTGDSEDDDDDIEGWSRLCSETFSTQKALYCVTACIVGAGFIIYLLRLFWEAQGPHLSSTTSPTTTTTTTTTDNKRSDNRLTASFSFSYGYLTWIFGSVPLTCQWLCLMISLFYDFDGVTHTRYNTLCIVDIVVLLCASRFFMAGFLTLVFCFLCLSLSLCLSPSLSTHSCGIDVRGDVIVGT